MGLMIKPHDAHRWSKCPGSVKMAELYPEPEDSTRSLEGVAAHWVGSEAVNKRPVSIGTIAPNGVSVTDEMVDGAELYVESLRPLSSVCEVYVEKSLACRGIHESCSGVPDYVAKAANTLHITEYKFGHAFVDVVRNEQLLCYAEGLIEKMNIDGWVEQMTDVEFTIVQPRNFDEGGSVRRWKVKAVDLRGDINRLKAAAAEACSDNPQLVTGSHCLNCPGVTACPAAQQTAQTAVAVSRNTLPVNMTPEILSLMYRNVKQAEEALKSMKGGLEVEILERMKRGVVVPCFEIGTTRGSTVWNKPPEEVKALGEMLGVKFGKDATITPTQAKELLKKAKLDTSIVDIYSEIKPGGTKIVPADFSETRAIFGRKS